MVNAPLRAEKRMMAYSYLHIYPSTIVIFLAVGLLIVLSNYFYIPRLNDFPDTKEFPRVSVLIPARNEEINIKTCVDSLLAQDYPDFEVLVLDDNSTDQTRPILEAISQRDPRLHILQGEPLPSGWLGKHWACHQLSLKATGELILFTDADTHHATETLRLGVSALIDQKADLLTAFPRQEMLTWGERLTVPILGFSILGFFPILLAEKLNLPAVSVTTGQFMLFRRSALEAIGGYDSIRNHPVDDVSLGRKIISHGFRWKLMDATEYVTCRMYKNFSTALEGFTKNLFAFFDHHVALYCIGWFWIEVSFLVPLIVLVFVALNIPVNFPTPIAVFAVLEALLMIELAYRRFRFPAYLGLLYPISMITFALIASRSLIYSFLGYGSWKGRKLAPPAFKL
jgi:chlorobactene glucosyltransferase